MAATPALAQSAGTSGEVTPKSNGLSNTPAPKEEGTVVDPFARAKKFDRDVHFPENARMAAEKGDYDGAAAMIEDFMLKDKKVKENPCGCAVMRCYFYFQLRTLAPKYEEAFKAALQYAESLPQCATKSDLYLWKAKHLNFMYYNEDTVMGWLDKAIAADPYPDIYTTRGDRWLQRIETKKACEDYKKAMNEDEEAKAKYETLRCEDLEKNAAAEPKK